MAGRAVNAARRRPHRILAGLGLLLVALLAAGAIVLGPRILGDRAEQAGLAEFYAQPADAGGGEPGTIIRSEPLEGHPFAANAWRIMYRTTDLNGAAAVATGVVIAPTGAAPAEGRKVVAWAHPTTGSAEQCAPSRGFDPFMLIEGLRLMLERGYVVVATDYVGMGTAGPDSYLIGVTGGNTVLDSVRAARALEGADAGDSVLLWGHSQGGQAVLFAAERAPEYAPELQVDAVAVAAPAANLSALMGAHLNDISGATIGSYAFQAYADIYANRGASLETVLTADALAILPEMNKLCLLTDLTELHRIAQPVVGAFYAADPTKTEPWASLLRENSAGSVAFDAPLFVAQGLSDHLVVPADTAAFAEHERSLGIDVTYHAVEHANHGTVADLSLVALKAWLDQIGF